MIEIRTLGRTSIAVNGEELTGEAAWPRSLALIVYLAREPGPDRRDDVLGVLWPDREEKRARHALNQLLYTLRRSSPELDLESVRDRIDFATEVWLDVAEFERRLEAGDPEGAVELYDGPFLADLLIDVPEFEHWADRQRSDLRRKFRAAALELVGAAKSAGATERALTHCRRLVEVDPLDDEAQHILIELLHATGHRAAALRQYEDYRLLLARELEIEPLERTVELVERIRADSTGASGPSEGVGASGAPGTSEVSGAGSRSAGGSGEPGRRRSGSASTAVADAERDAAVAEGADRVPADERSDRVAKDGGSPRRMMWLAGLAGLAIGALLGVLTGLWLATLLR